ncbi:MAG: hypothetical protein ACREOC_06575 [Gemmatimonadales bacterium]
MADRGGWYAYDRLDNWRSRSADRIIPEFQTLATATLMPSVPGATDGFFVLGHEPECFLVLGWVPSANRPPLVTWAFGLAEPEPGCTRLIVRARAGRDYRFFGLPVWLSRRVARWAHFVMQRKQLLGIARRAEAG